MRFLEQSAKLMNGAEKINATLDEENNMKNRLEVNEYMRRAGSPQPEELSLGKFMVQADNVINSARNHQPSN